MRPSHTATASSPSTASARERLASQATSKSAFRLVLSTPCPSHRQPAGEPCWTISGDSAEDHRGLCDARIRAAGYSHAVSQRSLSKRLVAGRPAQ